jgi:hypothetical protein
MSRSFTANDIVVLPKLDAISALALGEALTTAVELLLKKQSWKTLPAEFAKRYQAVVATLTALRAALVNKGNASGEDPLRATTADQLLDATWSALFEWLSGWAKLPGSHEAKKAAPILADVFNEGLKFTQLKYKLEWGESAVRIERIKSNKHDVAIEALGGKPFLKKLYAHQKEYGEALGLTAASAEPSPSAALVSVRDALAGFESALRKYALGVTAYGEDDDKGPDAAGVAEALLLPLAQWESLAPRAASVDEEPAEDAADEPKAGETTTT